MTTKITVEKSPACLCQYCDRPFKTQHLHDLHLGEEHYDQLTEDELAAYQEALRIEKNDLFIFHLKVIASLVLLFFAFVYLYVFAWN
ncbi:MAG: hypothetical protein ABEI06_09680 [Halobacteriaceae archaeon]